MKYIISLAHFFQLFAHINIIQCEFHELVTKMLMPTISLNNSEQCRTVSIEWDWLEIECNLKRKFKIDLLRHGVYPLFWLFNMQTILGKILRPTNFRILICIRRILLWIRATNRYTNFSRTLTEERARPEIYAQCVHDLLTASTINPWTVNDEIRKIPKEFHLIEIMPLSGIKSHIRAEQKPCSKFVTRIIFVRHFCLPILKCWLIALG